MRQLERLKAQSWELSSDEDFSMDGYVDMWHWISFLVLNGQERFSHLHSRRQWPLGGFG